MAVPLLLPLVALPALVPLEAVVPVVPEEVCLDDPQAAATSASATTAAAVFQRLFISLSPLVRPSGRSRWTRITGRTYL